MLVDLFDFRPQGAEVVTNTVGTKADAVGYGVRFSITRPTRSHKIPF